MDTTLKNVTVMMVIAFLATLPVWLIRHANDLNLSPEGMSIVIGVICGTLAAVPTSALLMVILTRQDRLAAKKKRRMEGKEQ
ncbi:MAG: hypothetical protein JXM73_25360 [Anaerolineae bacterium]|nr:hypothetical protein [Anaerolineae bacterium]